MTGERERPSRRKMGSKDALLRPTAYFWFSFQRVCAIAFVPGLVGSFVSIFAFHNGWPAFALGLLAFGSQAGNIGGLVQRARELRLGYTTIPALAGEVTLRDPADGSVLTDGHAGHPPLKTMKLAREYARQGPVQSFTVSPPPALQNQESPQSEITPSPPSILVGEERRPWPTVIFVGSVAVLALTAWIFFFEGSSSKFRVAGFGAGLVLSAIALSVLFVSLAGAANRRLARQMRSLSDLPDEFALFPVRRTVELFGELPTDCLAAIQPEMVLSVSRDEVALWSGRGTLATVQSIPRGSIGAVSSSRAHDTRENEKPAILISYDDSRRLLLFPRVVGRGALRYADEVTTESIVGRIRAAVLEP
jgi:hypothetical protein